MQVCLTCDCGSPKCQQWIRSFNVMRKFLDNTGHGIHHARRCYVFNMKMIGIIHRLKIVKHEPCFNMLTSLCLLMVGHPITLSWNSLKCAVRKNCVMTENVIQLAILLFFRGNGELNMKFPVQYEQSIATATAMILITTVGVHLFYKGNTRNLPTEGEQHTNITWHTPMAKVKKKTISQRTS